MNTDSDPSTEYTVNVKVLEIDKQGRIRLNIKAIATDAAKEAGRLLFDMPRLWAGATVQERHQRHGVQVRM